MYRSGHADLPLHYGTVPKWLAERMSLLGGAIVENIIEHYGSDEAVKRLSDPLWFQSLGAVLGMDWHSSGITTSVITALKKSLNPISKQTGLYICGGRGRYSRRTPDELLAIGDSTGLDGADLVRNSRLTAKIDNTAMQDGFQIYLHSFILSKSGKWAVVQQGMDDKSAMARRYHWHSPEIKSFVEEPHTLIYGQNRGEILNLVHKKADNTRKGILSFSQETPQRSIAEARSIIMPRKHEVASRDVDLKRLGAVLAVAYETEVQNFEDLLLIDGLGPRTLQSLALVSEVIHGTPSRFKDPARFSFAHGGKDGHPFPVPITVYDETIHFMKETIERSKITYSDKQRSLKNLHQKVLSYEKNSAPMADFERVIQHEKQHSKKWGGRTVFDSPKTNSLEKETKRDKQLTLFD